jgi:hypothetical protein
VDNSVQLACEDEADRSTGTEQESDPKTKKRSKYRSKPSKRKEEKQMPDGVEMLKLRASMNM